jgi:hypothetical protein
MAEKLVYVKPIEIKEAVMKFGWLTEFGSYNRIPQPFGKIDDLKYSDIAKRGTPEYMEYRMLAIVEGETDKYIPSVIYWYNDTGLMVVFDDTNLMEFYQLGCQHDFEEKTEKGRTDLKCKHCGYIDVEYDEPVIVEEIDKKV